MGQKFTAAESGLCPATGDRVGESSDRRGWRQGQCGFVTVEMAFALLGVAVAVVLAAGLIPLGMTQMRCQDVAAEVARQAARGDLNAVQEITEAFPQGSVDIGSDAGVVVVDVKVEVRPWGAWLPAITVGAQSKAVSESSADGDR